jgi:hypothetical protein
MANENEFFKFHDLDNGGHYYEPVSVQNSESGSGGLARFLAICAGIIFAAIVLRGLFSSNAEPASYTYSAPTPWATIIFSVFGGLAALAFAVFQMVVAFRDRSSYWGFRAVRWTGLRLVNFFRFIGRLLRLGWKGAILGGSATATGLVRLFAWFKRLNGNRARARAVGDAIPKEFAQGRKTSETEPLRGSEKISETAQTPRTTGRDCDAWDDGTAQEIAVTLQDRAKIPVELLRGFDDPSLVRKSRNN